MLAIDQPWILLCVSLFLLVLEFYLPGGIMAILSGVIYLVALYQALTLFDGPHLSLFMIVSLLAPIFVIYCTIRRIRKSGDKNTFYLSKSQEGYQGAEFDESLIGKTGVAVTDLGPSGFIHIDGRRVQVLSQSGYLEKGTSVVVLGGRGAYLVVQKAL